MSFFLRYLKDHKWYLAFLFLCVAVFAAIFWLYGIPLGVVLYPASLCAGLGAVLLAADIYRKYRQHKVMFHLRALPDSILQDLEAYQTLADEDYRELIRLLLRQQSDVRQETARKMEDMVDYYTTWAHQIKTPIASMRLKLEGEDSPAFRALSDDLFRIEQYVSMVLCYLRLDSDFSDFVFQEYSLDEILKSAVRKFAGQFIGKGIRLQYRETDKTVLTYEKWLSFVVEQLLSNALKYTMSGSISIFVEEPVTLCIRDTGIGIAPEDLPRIFDRGYTGFNGRMDHRASGLGLYLCRRICDNLGIAISVHSAVGEGTEIRLDLEHKRRIHE